MRPRLGFPAAALPAQQDSALARRIDAIVDQAPLHRSQWGIEAWDPLSRQPLYQRDAHKHFIPASNLKLVVAAAATHLLGPNFQFRTTVHATRPIRIGTLHGDPVLYRRGDSTIGGRYATSTSAIWEALADTLRAGGVQRVSGSLVADQSAWDTVHVHGDWSNYDLLWWYAAPTGALGFNDNSVDFHVRPGGAVGEPARISAAPQTSGYIFENRTRTVATGRPKTLDFERRPRQDRLHRQRGFAERVCYASGRAGAGG